MPTTITSPNIGDTVTCAETGKPFTVEAQGIALNYARSTDGDIFSDEGAYERQKRQLLNRAAPFVCYISNDKKHVTDWKGNILGNITRYTESDSGFHRSAIARVRVTDIHGAVWQGRGAGAGMVCTLRAVLGNRGILES